jgi:hypothetical protein
MLLKMGHLDGEEPTVERSRSPQPLASLGDARLEVSFGTGSKR